MIFKIFVTTAQWCAVVLTIALTVRCIIGFWRNPEDHNKKKKGGKNEKKNF